MIQYRVELKRREVVPKDQTQTADEVLEKYIRFGEAARMEKHWINERLGWLFTPQAILFAALGFTFSDKVPVDQHAVNIIRALIPLVAMCICIVVFVVVLAACVMHGKWTGKMIECVQQYNAAGGRGEDLTFGSAPYWPASWARWFTLPIPVVFFVAWVGIFFGGGLYRGLCLC